MRLLVIALLVLTSCSSGGDDFAQTKPSDPVWPLNVDKRGGNSNVLLTPPKYAEFAK